MLSDQKDEAVCYTDGMVVKENFQMCNITNKKIVEQLRHDGIPQATFSCNADRRSCNFQFWVKQKESFYCALDGCDWKRQETETRNTTTYECEKLKCACVPGRMLCGKDGSVDLGDFLEGTITGPATFTTISTEGGSNQDGSVFSEPNMNDLIAQFFGDRSITLNCKGGECMHRTQVPGYERPINKINTPLIAGVIAGVALFLLAVLLLVFLLNRRSNQRYGPVRLDTDEEEENARLLGDHKPAALYFENIHYELKGKKILSDIAGAVHPGELLAIMGASGAGKTSFLDILARKKKRGAVMGDFWLNGEKVPNDDFRSVIGFVDQDDTMLPTLTVHETILDSALLRLPKEMSRNAKEQKVEDVERQLGIYHIRHQVIGSEEGAGRGISGGEKRRVGIACELVTSPSILFLDEPTSGLDAYNAFNVVECLVTLVKTYNRTVVFTIHQPRSNIVALFDQTMLLAEGRLVYSGPSSKCQSYFDSIGYSCPPGFNIADYMIDLTMHADPPLESEDGEDDNDGPGYLAAIENGRMTRASSTMAVKSVRSVNGSLEDRSSLRPKPSRKSSVRQQQERQLYSRRNTQDHTPASVRSEGDSIMDGDPDSVRLKQQAPPSLASDIHALPPSAPSDGPSNLDILVSAFAESDVSADLHNAIHNAINTASESNGHPNGTTTCPILPVQTPRLPQTPPADPIPNPLAANMAQPLPQPHAHAHALRHSHPVGRASRLPLLRAHRRHQRLPEPARDLLLPARALRLLHLNLLNSLRARTPPLCPRTCEGLLPPPSLLPRQTHPRRSTSPSAPADDHGRDRVPDDGSAAAVAGVLEVHNVHRALQPCGSDDMSLPRDLREEPGRGEFVGGAGDVV